MELSKQTRILVVDDLESMRKVTSNQLRSMGAINIATASNGAEALTLLRNQPFDIILSDWNMPVMTGLELLKSVRTDERLYHLPFVMITAEAARHQIEEAISYGVSDLIVKPYTPAGLSERITRALARKSRNVRHTPKPFADEQDFPVESSPASADDRRPSILVVDDTPDNLKLLSRLFNAEYQVRIAHNGMKALGICQSSNPPDLVLLDIMMPGIDGFEVAKRMREHPGSENIPIIFVTALDGDDARMQGLELGAVDFITKPIEPHVLKPRVKNFLRYVELHKQLQADYDSMMETARLREDVEHITRHDMKGPLSGILGLVQMMASKAPANSEPAKQLRMVEEAALQVLDMINLSSELYKIETGRFRLDARPVNIVDILQRTIEVARAAFAAKQLSIVQGVTMPPDDSQASEELPQALGDAMFCYSIFQNLLKNACEAAPAKGRIFVTLKCDDPMKITILNNGVVPAGIRTQFFDKFVTSGKSGGTGLGTYSAKLLTEAQNGKIELEVSDEDSTTTIVVTLPRYPGA